VVEHLDEAAMLVRDREASSRLHFTVPEGGEDAFRREVEAAAEPGSRLELELSTQSPSTDTVALDAGGRPFRTPDGALLFRPGGHGALLRNLDRMGGDLVLVKNIDNVQPAERREQAILWQRLLIGLLVELERQSFALLDRLDDERDAGACADARRFLARWFEPERGGDAGTDRCDDAERRALRAKLERPLRVAGMVAVSGEPGGGPFWTRDREGRVSKQIVESAEQADLILSGVIRSLDSTVASVNRDDEVLQYESLLIMDVTLRRREPNEILWRGQGVRLNQVYAGSRAAVVTTSSAFQSTTTLNSRDVSQFTDIQLTELDRRAVRDRLMEQFARELHQRVTEMF